MNTQPERTVTDNVLVSTTPVIKIKVADDFIYLGKLDFILYGVATVELFVFVSAQERKADRFLIFQFERYLDTNTHTYTYPPTRVFSIGEHEYVHDTFTGPISDEMANPESDSAITLNYILEQGYTLPEEVITSRFVRLLDATRRSEILFSHNESLANLGYNAADISDDYRLKPEHNHISDVQGQRALSTFTVIEG
jgi:hypothetical protein